MADIALRTADTINLVESLEQHTAPAGVAIVAGQAVKIDGTTGKFVLADDARAYGIAMTTARVGEGVTAIRQGILEGYVLDALAFDAAVYLGGLGQAGGTAAGNLNAVAGTPSVLMGRVFPGYMNPITVGHDKLLRLETAKL